MKIIDGLKTCRKGLHQYNSNLRQCPECKRESNLRWYKQNPERQKESNRRWKEQNPERVRENNRRWRQQNPEQGKERMRRWREQNPEREKENKRHWREQNSDKGNAYVAKRRAAKKQAVAPWADLEAIKQIYAEAAELTKSTGIPHQVDHIYPLRSDYMCGLHVETNLQILTKSENASKHNRTWPGQLDCQRSPISQVFTPEQIALAREQTARS